MNTPLPPDRDDELPGEAELAALYRKLPASEPGPALDAAVLRAAAQALSGSSAATRTRRPARWLIPLSSAAMLVLVAGLAWHMRGMPVAEHAAMQAAAPAAASTSTTTAPENTAVAAPMQERAAAFSPKQPPPPPAQTMAATAPVQTAGALESAEAPRQPAPRLRAPSAARMSKPYTPNLIAKAYKPDQTTLAQDKSADNAVGELRKQAGTRTDAMAAAQADARANDNLSAAVVMNAPAEPEAEAAPAPAPAAPAPPVPVEETAAAPEDRALAKDQPVQAEAAPMAAPALAADTERRSDDTPAQELVKIRLLFAQHRDDEAQKRLLAFQHDHPEQKLPEDLRGRLPVRP